MLFPLPLRAALILYHIQNCLSSTFFKFFQKFFLCRSLLRDSFNIISLSFLFVKYFFKFFQKVFCDQLRSLSRQLNYYITFSSLCQVLFEKFFQLVSVFLPEWTSLTLSLLIDSFQSKSNILLTLSRGPPRSTVMLLYTFFLTLSSKDVFLYQVNFWLFCTKREHLSLFSPKLPRFSFIYNVAVANIFIYHF